MTIAALPCALNRGGGTKATPGSLRSVAPRRSRPSPSRPRSGRSAAITSGPFVPGPKPSRVQVVGLARHRVRRVVAGVGEAEPHAERRAPRARAAAPSRRSPPATAGAGRRGSSAPRGELAVCPRAFQPAAEERDPQAVDPRPEVREQRRQQRDRREHHDEHRERGRERDPVHVGQAGQAESEHGDHDGAARDDHAAPGGRDRLDDGVVAILASVHRRAEAGQDEQRVVDADADPDQARDGRGPVGDVDDVGQQQRSGRRR